MDEGRCPICASQKFYVKDAEDEFEIYDFEFKDGRIVFAEGVEVALAPSVTEDTAAYCSRCSWHGAVGGLKKNT
jgi:hypothetical protein